MNPLPFRTAADLARCEAAVADHLEGGGLLAYPTETVYGFGSRARAADLESLCRLKGRPPGKPFLLLVSSLAMIEREQLLLSPGAVRMAEACWPGPLTLVLPGGEGKLPDILRGPEGGIAVRLTSHALIRELIETIGHPISSTSANRPGGPPAPGAAAIVDMFAAEVEEGRLLVLDGGTLGHVPSSTIVDCTGHPFRVVREGAIPRGELERLVGSGLL